MAFADSLTAPLKAGSGASLRRRITALAILLTFGGVLVAESDLRKRSKDEVRGPKFVWRVACTNALGAIAYLMWGRRG